jgi:nucleoside phosphorylase
MVAMPIDLAILIALEEEFQVLEHELGERWEPRSNPDYGGYDFFWTDERGGYRCVAAFIGRIGAEEAVQGAERLLRTKPALLVNVGIAAGIHEDVCIGDVVVPDLVQAYDQASKVVPAKGPDGKESTTELEWKPRANGYQAEHALVEEAQSLRYAHRAAHRTWQDEGAKELSTIRKANDAAVQGLLNKVVLRHRPEVRKVALASGGVVIAARAFAEEVRKTNGNLMAAEMEAAGILLAATKKAEHVKTLVIRGISDHVSVAKEMTDAIQRGALRGLAMRNAWRLLMTMMQLGVLPRAEASGSSSEAPADRPLFNHEFNQLLDALKAAYEYVRIGIIEQLRVPRESFALDEDTAPAVYHAYRVLLRLEPFLPDNVKTSAEGALMTLQEDLNQFLASMRIAAGNRSNQALFDKAIQDLRFAGQRFAKALSEIRDLMNSLPM